ncbi:hypothetical protein [Pseudanabaena sp. PCC 6802]|uniref:hypothetical protein n=1 Tax=Pseudanabaena sp. PCC 6802 TaxID=118173 RepID=UPI000347584B|nr:hypothetical protein [Pseudanabaena sp. PCC 6802]
MSDYSLLMRQTVKKFWQEVNWENRPIPVVSVAAAQPEINGQSETSELSAAFTVAPALMLNFKMSVRDYLNAIPWAGAPLVAAPTPAAAVVEDNEHKIDTLDDFLADISQFF